MTPSPTFAAPDFATLARPHILQQPVYEPGKPIELAAREAGLEPSAIVKLASNENPWGAPPAALQAMAEALASEVHRYPDNACWKLRAALAERLAVAPGEIVFGAGSNELIGLLCQVLAGSGTEVVMGRGAFISYRIATLLVGATPVEVPLRDLTHDLPAMLAAVTARTRLLFLPSPNNPTGTANPPDAIAALLDALPPHVVVVLDEAYAEYQAPGTTLDVCPRLRAGAPVVSLRTFSKIYGLSGLRIGYGLMPAALAKLVERVRPPFNVTGLAQAAALAALHDPLWVEQSRLRNEAGRTQLREGFARLGVPVVPGAQGNFLLVGVPQGRAWAARLQAKGVIVRPVDLYGLPDHLRISIGTPAENDRLLAVWTELQQR